MVGLVIGNKQMSEFSYAIIALFMLLMFFAEFAAESADIVHESMPTEKMQMELSYMLKNYNPN